MDHAIVVGASSGIGLAAAKALRKEGYAVSGLSRREVPPASVDGWYPCDVTEEGAARRAIDAAIDARGVPAALIYSSGLPVMGDTLQVPTSESRRAFDVNFWGFDVVARHVLAPMTKAGRGALVYVSTIAAIRSLAHEAFYAASKAAAVRYAGCLDQEFRGRGVRVKALHVGYVETGFFERAGWHGMEAPHPSGSGVTADDVAGGLLRLMKSSRTEEVFGWRERVIALADRVSPAIYDGVLKLRAAR